MRARELTAGSGVWQGGTMAWTPLAAFALGSLAGLAVLLGTRRKLTRRTVAHAVLWNGLSALAAALLLRTQVADAGVLLGVAIMVGTGSLSLVDIVQAGIRAKFGGGGGLPPATP